MMRDRDRRRRHNILCRMLGLDPGATAWQLSVELMRLGLPVDADDDAVSRAMHDATREGTAVVRTIRAAADAVDARAGRGYVPEADARAGRLTARPRIVQRAAGGRL